LSWGLAVLAHPFRDSCQVLSHGVGRFGREELDGRRHHHRQQRCGFRHSLVCAYSPRASSLGAFARLLLSNLQAPPDFLPDSAAELSRQRAEVLRLGVCQK
jgi:hypothetical protein